MKSLLSFFFALLLAYPVFGQKKDISQARSYIKSRSNLDKAESLMLDLLKDSANRQNIKIYLTLAEAVRAQYDAANEKLYLKEKADTGQFFLTARKMFLVYEKLDSLDMQPDKKGNVKPKFRKKNAEYLNKFRSNLYSGGIFFIKKKDYDSAFDLMDTYIDCRRQPLFSEYTNENTDSLYAPAAFRTVFCGHKLGRPDSVLKYSEIALKSRKYRRRTLVYMSRAYLAKKDTVKYVEILRKGFAENKTSKYFFTRLMDYYNGLNLLDSAMNVVNAALEQDKDNTLFLFAKSNMLLNMGRYEECISISDTLLARNDTLPDVYLNAGVSYINLALAEEASIKKNKNRTAVKKKQVLNYYKKALPYMEKYRALAPEDKERWAPSLYNIYLKLNMGRKFEEISDILRKMRN